MIDLADVARRGLVLYTQPGILLPPREDRRSAFQDSLQHDSYIALHHSFARVIPDGAIIGVAAYPDRAQFDASREWRRQNPVDPDAVKHHLLGDPHLRLADSLQLPTSQIDGHRYYQRTTILAIAGRIAKVFHPATAGRDAQQALAWLQLR